MNELQVFENKEFGKIRSLEIDNEPYFVAKEICILFGDTNYRRSLSNIDEEDKKLFPIETAGGKQNMIVINENGLYDLLFSMQPQKAKGVSQNEQPVIDRIEKLKRFKRWVTHEVLPSIRKHGGYIAGQEQMTDEEIMAKAVLMANSKIKELNQKNNELEAKNSQLVVANEIMKPKAEYFDDLVDRNLLTGFRETAKELGVKEKSFMNFLFEHKYIYRDKRGKPQPFANKNKGLFEVKETKNEKTGWTGTQTLITPKGRETFKLLCVGI